MARATWAVRATSFTGSVTPCSFACASSKRAPKSAPLISARRMPSFDLYSAYTVDPATCAFSAICATVTRSTPWRPNSALAAPSTRIFVASAARCRRSELYRRLLTGGILDIDHYIENLTHAGAVGDVPGLSRQHPQEDGQDPRGLFRRREGAVARRPGGKGRSAGGLAQAGFRPGARPRHGDLGGVQAQGLDRAAEACRESAPGEGRVAMSGAALHGVGESGMAARLAAIGSLAVALIILALHAIKPEYQPAWRFISEYAIGPYGWLMKLAFLVWA